MLIRINRIRNRLTLFVALTLASAWLLPSSIVLAQTPAPAAAEAKPITTADIKGISGPSAADLAKGDPGGTLTGTVNDIPVTDSKAGLSLADVVNTVGQNRIAIIPPRHTPISANVRHMAAMRGALSGRPRLIPKAARQAKDTTSSTSRIGPNGSSGGR